MTGRPSSRRSSGFDITVHIGDVTDYRLMEKLFQEVRPEVAVHYAEQPSGPYSMIGYDEAKLTLSNNLDATMNLIWAVMEYAPECHIIKLGTMGEYGTPNIDIEEGWIDIEHKGRKGTFLFPGPPAASTTPPRCWTRTCSGSTCGPLACVSPT